MVEMDMGDALLVANIRRMNRALSGWRSTREDHIADNKHPHFYVFGFKRWWIEPGFPGPTRTP